MDAIYSALLIFFLRLSDMTLDTLRLLFMMRGRKIISGLIGVAQATIFVIAIGRVLSQMDNILNVIGYAVGFGAGVVVGMILEERMALGFGQMRVVSPKMGYEIAAKLRGAGYGVTEFSGQGRDGLVNMLLITVRRKDVDHVQKMVLSIDESAFITIEEVRPLWRGFYRA